MDREIKKRKKRFWAFCLALVFVIVQSMPVDVLAYDVIYNQSDGTYSLDDGITFLTVGQSIVFDVKSSIVSSASFTYLKEDGTILGTESADLTGQTSWTLNAPSYATISGSTEDPEAFKGWSVESIHGSSGYVSSITLQAVMYTQSNITYVIDGEEDNATYYEGKPGVSLADASKANYTFEGWYTDASFRTGTGPYTSVQTEWTGVITLYAKFTADTYTITYHNVDGATNANPATYAYDEGVASLADASKTGYTFGGWYSDEGLTNQVDSIPPTNTGAVDLYAKFTPNTYAVEYELDGGTNGAGNPIEYTYGIGVTSLADASKTGYTFDGWYKDDAFTTKITSVSATQIGTVKLYAKFTFIKLRGEGSVSVADVYYGKTPEAVVASSTNGTSAVTIQYKEKGASDNTYTYLKPTKVGEYTVRATFASTEKYLSVTALDDFSISYLDAPKSPYILDGTKGENSYYTSAVTILPPNGYLIADSLDGTYMEKLTLTESSDGFYVYLIKASTGEKTSGIKVPEIKIDNTLPTILGAASGETIYGDTTEVIVKDDNLRQVYVNGEMVEFENGRAVLQLSSNQGEEEYEIIGVDRAGNRSVTNIVVAADWMKTRQIPSGVKVKLFSKYSYTLGSGTWKVNGDSTTYAGGTSFYVKSDGEYTFSNIK